MSHFCDFLSYSNFSRIFFWHFRNRNCFAIFFVKLKLRDFLELFDTVLSNKIDGLDKPIIDAICSRVRSGWYVLRLQKISDSKLWTWHFRSALLVEFQVETKARASKEGITIWKNFYSFVSAGSLWEFCKKLSNHKTPTVCKIWGFLEIRPPES